MGKPNFWFDENVMEWKLTGRGDVLLARFGQNGTFTVQALAANLLTNASIGEILNVATRADLRALLVNTVGTIQNLNVGTLATLRSTNVAGVASLANAQIAAGAAVLTNVTIGTLASVRGLNVNTQGSVQNLNVGTLATLQAANIGAGDTLSKIGFLSGTLGGIAAVGTSAIAVGTVTGMTGLAVGDKVFGLPKSALAGNIGIAGFHVPTTNVLNAYVINPDPVTAGSLPSVGLDVLYIR